MVMIGKLDTRISIMQRTGAVDAIGQPLPDDWAAYCPPVWANLRYNSGAESIKAGADTSIVKVSMRIRHLAGVTAGMRVEYGGEVFDIKAQLPNRRKGYTDLVCELVA